MTDQEITNILTGNWTPGQVAAFEQAHEPRQHYATEDGYCTCGGRYGKADTMQGTHPTEGVWTQDTYQCDKCRTWLIVQFDAQGVEFDRQYEPDQT